MSNYNKVFTDRPQPRLYANRVVDDLQICGGTCGNCASRVYVHIGFGGRYECGHPKSPLYQQVAPAGASCVHWSSR